MALRVASLMLLLALCRCTEGRRCDSNLLHNRTNTLSYVDNDQGLIFLVRQPRLRLSETEESYEILNEYNRPEYEYETPPFEIDGDNQYRSYEIDYQADDDVLSEDEEEYYLNLDFDDDSAYETAGEEFYEYDPEHCTLDFASEEPGEEYDDISFVLDNYIHIKSFDEDRGYEEIDSESEMRASSTYQCLNLRTNLAPYINEYEEQE